MNFQVRSIKRHGINSAAKQAFLVLLIMIVAPSIAFPQGDLTAKKAKVEEYLQLAEKNKQAGDIKEATRFINEAATLVWEDKNYTDAITYFNQSIELNKQINNESGISKIQSNLGMIYADMGQYENSLDHFSQSLVYREKSGTKSEVISCRINIAVVLNNLKKHTEAAKNLEAALELATEMNDINQMKACYGMLAETYEKAGNQERTQHYFNLYRTFHEMIQKSTVSAAKKETEQAQVKALRTDLEKKQKEIELLKTYTELRKTEEELSEVSKEARSLIESNTKQELAISLLEREAELDSLKIKEVEDRASRQRLIIAIIVILLLAGLFFALQLFRNLSYKRKVNAQLAQQYEEIKALNDRATKTT